VGEYPQNFLLQKLPLAKTLACNVFIWGAVVACSAASTRFGSLMAVRFLLGFFESCIQPAMMLLCVFLISDVNTSTDVKKDGHVV
jgi:MFS family permease